MFQLPGNMMAEIEIPDADESSDSETKCGLEWTRSAAKPSSELSLPPLSSLFVYTESGRQSDGQRNLGENVEGGSTRLQLTWIPSI